MDINRLLLWRWLIACFDIAGFAKFLTRLKVLEIKFGNTMDIRTGSIFITRSGCCQRIKVPWYPRFYAHHAAAWHEPHHLVVLHHPLVVRVGGLTGFHLEQQTTPSP
jgi:hypothetical protein